MLNAAMVLVLALGVGEPCDGDFIQNSWELLRDARWGTERFERAAFAVLDGRRRIHFIRWQAGANPSRADYVGTIPANAWAIVHTHPNVLPNPSGNDERVAERLGMPVYVVTRGSISMTAGLRRTKVLVLGDWNPARCR